MPAKKVKKEEKTKSTTGGETKPKRICKPRKKSSEGMPEKEHKTVELSAKTTKETKVEQKPKRVCKPRK
ncbi:MAG: hypothetical protein ACP5RR_09395, partial [Candidatus Kapaibacteriota bacterium]